MKCSSGINAERQSCCEESGRQKLQLRLRHGAYELSGLRGLQIDCSDLNMEYVLQAWVVEYLAPSWWWCFGRLWTLIEEMGINLEIYG